MERPKTIHGHAVQAKRLYDVIVYKDKQAVGIYIPKTGLKSCVFLIYWRGGVGYAEPEDVQFLKLNRNEQII